MKQQANNKGFTIIEVVLVLAIAGLIFLMVFIALPALQRSQADTQRRSDVSRMLAQLSNYQANSHGAVPTDQASLTAFVNSYMTPTSSDTFNDPDGNAYQVKYINTATASPTTDVIDYMTNASCNGSIASKDSTRGARQVAVEIKLAVGTYCVQN